MKETKYTCDGCKDPIDGTFDSTIAGGGELCTILYDGRMGHNEVPHGGWHFHYACFIGLPEMINSYVPPKITFI